LIAISACSSSDQQSPDITAGPATNEATTAQIPQAPVPTLVLNTPTPNLTTANATATTVSPGGGPTATVSPNEPSATANPPTPVETDGPLPTPSVRQVPVTGDLVLPICMASGTNDGGFGTVPFPTPTPNPELQESKNKIIAREFAVVELLVANLISATFMADALWDAAETSQERANLIYTEIVRLEQMCSASPLSLVLDETEDVAGALISAISTRILALESVWIANRDGTDITASENLREESVKQILELVPVLDFYSAAYGATLGKPVEQLQLYGERVKIGVTIPENWILLHDDSRIIAQAPLKFQDFSIEGLGPEIWEIGVALQIRMFNAGLIERKSAGSDVVATLLEGLGTEVQRRSTSVNGTQLTIVEYVDRSRNWQTFAAIIPANDYIFLLELGCLLDRWDECESTFSTILDSVEYS